MKQTFYVGLKAFITNDDGQALFLYREKSHGLSNWDLPGGCIEPGETYTQCLVRELNEELPGIQNIRVLTRLRTVRTHWILEDGAGLIFETYRVTAKLPDPIVLNSEHTRYRWDSPWEFYEMIK